MGTQPGSNVIFALTLPRQIISQKGINVRGQNWKENSGTRVLLTKAISKRLAASPSPSFRWENRHFVNPAALNATDTEACPGLCNHSHLCQQQGNKLTKLQIRLFSEMTNRQNKSSPRRCTVSLRVIFHGQTSKVNQTAKSLHTTIIKWINTRSMEMTHQVPQLIVMPRSDQDFSPLRTVQAYPKLPRLA